MERPKSVKCENCMFFNCGMCKRYPPQFVSEYGNITLNNNGASMNGTIGGSSTIRFPYVDRMDFCGEFLPTDNLTAVEWIAWKKGLLEDGKLSS